MTPEVRIQAMQKPYRARFWAQRRTRGIELVSLPTYEYNVNNVNCSDNIGSSEPSQVRDGFFSYLGWTLSVSNLGRIFVGIK